MQWFVQKTQEIMLKYLKQSKNNHLQLRIVLTSYRQSIVWCFRKEEQERVHLNGTIKLRRIKDASNIKNASRRRRDFAGLQQIASAADYVHKPVPLYISCRPTLTLAPTFLSHSSSRSIVPSVKVRKDKQRMLSTDFYYSR
jgi:hypothetical protein